MTPRQKSAAEAAQAEAATLADKAMYLRDAAVTLFPRGSASALECLGAASRCQRDAADAAYWSRVYAGIEAAA